MTINYTTLLGLAKPVTGTESGAWGDVVNDQITSLVEDAIANAASISVTSGDVTLTDNNGSSDQARMAILLVTGSPGVSRNIVAPSTSKWYIVKNGSNAAVVLKGSATTGVTIPTGSEVLAFWNGSDFEIAGMVGPSTSTDNAVARFDGTTGKVVQNSSVVIDDSGNVGIGTSSPSYKLDVTGNTRTTGYAAINTIPSAAAALRIGQTADQTLGTDYSILFSGVGYSGGISLNATSMQIGQNSASRSLTFHCGTSFAERMRIDSSGNVGIGTSSPSTRLQVSGDILMTAVGDDIIFPRGIDNNTSLLISSLSGGNELQIINQSGSGGNLVAVGNGVLRFQTEALERMRIDSSGNLLVGSTSQPITSVTARLIATHALSDFVVGVRSTGATPYGVIVDYSTSPNSTGSEPFLFKDSSATRFTVRSNGGVVNYQANDVNLSDRREKTDFEPAKNYLPVICAIPVQTFNYIDQSKNDPGKTIGVVAQDVQAVAPELVHESNWGTAENPKIRLSIYQTDLQYVLMKCIQEQQAIIESLTARIAALESKGA